MPLRSFLLEFSDNFSAIYDCDKDGSGPAAPLNNWMELKRFETGLETIHVNKLTSPDMLKCKMVHPSWCLSDCCKKKKAAVFEQKVGNMIEFNIPSPRSLSEMECYRY